jgi:CheY-like chemotaxis protein
MKRINCILLVDDNPADNYYNQYIIKEADVCNSIQTAINGFDALSYLRKSGDTDQSELFPKPDIIFLDINMPRMNGFEFLGEYKKLDESLKSKVLIVMLTTSLNPEDWKTAKTFKEISEYQGKPLSIETLQEIIENYF